MPMPTSPKRGNPDLDNINAKKVGNPGNKGASTPKKVGITPPGNAQKIKDPFSKTSKK